MTFLGDTEVRDFTGYRHFDLLDDDLRNDITFSHHEQQQELRLQNYSNGVLDVDGNDGNNYREQVTIHQQQQCQREEEPQQQASVEHGANPFKGSHPLVRRFWVFIGLVFSNPFIAMFIIVGSTITTSLLLWYALTGFETPHIDISLDSFQIPNHVSYIREDMFNTAIQDLTHRRKRDADEFSEANIVKHSLQKFLHGYQESLSAKRSKREIIQRHRNKRWKMSLVYLAKGDNEHNVFTEERLSVIHQIEKKIVGHKQFTDFCVKNYESYKDEALGVIDYCAPVNSLLTYFYPSEVNGKVMYDGMGSHLADIDGSLKKAMTHQTFYWYVDESMDKKNPKSRLLRSEVSFGMPIADCFWPDGTPKTVDEQHDEYVKFIVSYVSMLDKESTDSISVLYGGNELFDWEVQETFYHDLSMGAISGGLILVLVIILSSFSLWLSIWGFLTIAFSFALAFVVYRVCFGYESFGILIGISVFVVIGIGVDDVFVFINTFRQSKHIHKLEERMAFTIKTAGMATLFTSFTTAAAFAANTASQIPAIHDFGLFMALVVSFCWFYVVLLMPPVLTIWHFAFEKCETFCYLPCTNDVVSGPNGNPYRIFSTGQQQPHSINHGTTLDDVQMLDMEDIDTNVVSLVDDVPLIDIGMTEELNPVISEKTGCGMMTLTATLQQFIYKGIGLPVIRARYIVIGLYIAILICSASFLSQLMPASKPPQLFKEDTNLQQLINIAYNFSGTDISCDQCSGLFMDRGENIAQSDSAVTIPPRQTGELSTTTKPRVRDLPTIASTTTSVPIKTCKEVKCLFNGTCNMETLQCMCKRCEYHKRMPVCGKDGVTYNSNCDLMYTQCEIQKFIPIDHQGECKQVPIPTVKPDHSSDHGGSEHHIPDKPPVDTDSAVNEPTAQSPKAGYNPCANGSCDSADRPSLGNGAIVYVVFGINGIDQSNLTGEHVLEESRGSVIYTDQPLDFNDADILKSICTICKNIVNQENPKLVTKGGAQCFPTEFEDKIDMLGFIYPECKDIPKPALLKGQKSHSMAARLSENEFVFRWYALAFESTTFQGVSSFAAYKDFLEWEKLITKEVEKLPEDSPLRSAFQTCEFWKTIFMEVLGVTSAIYGLVFSMLVCVLSVAVFTGHVGLLVVVMLTISGIIFLVVGMFYIFGWQMGAIEALSLSILVGSSVDYCAHLVEGYLLAGSFLPANLHLNKEKRQWRTGAAVSHIGVSILSSAVTTIIASIPLCVATIQPLAKFGQIVAMNTLVSIFYTLTACVSFLSIFAPANYTWSIKWVIITLIIVGFGLGSIIASAYIAFLLGVTIPGPSGESLF